MIKINKVSSLKKERKELRYEDLEDGEAFVWEKGQTYICIKNKGGHLYEDLGILYQGKGFASRDVIPADAEINWCIREGE